GGAPALEDDVVDVGVGEATAHRQPGLAGADDDGVGGGHARLLVSGRHGPDRCPGRADGRSSSRSAGVDGDADGHAVGQYVEHGGTVPGLLHDGAQLLGIVTADGEADPDLLVPVADLVGQAEDPEQVDVALDGRLDRREVDAPRGGDVGDAG